MTSGPATTAETSRATDRIPVIEGMRGLAAVVVAAGHILQLDEHRFTSGGRWLDAPLVDKLLWPLRFGPEMVAVFLFLSAFSLVYQEQRRRTPSTMRQYALRRAWRIGPVYYCALAFGALVVALTPSAVMSSRPEFQNLPASTDGLLSHLVLLHNLRPAWSTQINGPLWSLSYEAELYLVLPLVVWLMLRTSAWLVAGVGAVAAEMAVGHVPLQVDLLTPFLFGVLGALTFPRLTDRVASVAALGGSLLLLYGTLGGPGTDRIKGHDLVWYTGLLLLIPALCHLSRTRSWGSGAVLGWLGRRSYSLYAFHFPVVLISYALARHVSDSELGGMLFTGIFAVPAILLVTSVTFKWVEQPSLRRVSEVRST